MTDCSQLYEYVNNYCGSCDYNWTLHIEFIKECGNEYWRECVNTCGLEGINKIPFSDTVAYSNVFGIFLFLLRFECFSITHKQSRGYYDIE